ncbi:MULTISPECIES: response regulator transcription factor [Microcoleus]|uniref:Response regulator transcription factor n=1 Tax=Microcoleus anatoxicus PTRS2 TaxID=2705321 RepID=A0ABU8YG54_9CYAN|nr:MAG: DNA-binding response regulator [Oscillatoriales cyanobacterium]TAD95531.1 MAG: DNA-binding response regulator [Oscillatoriales cyanobacterium]TAE01061.1 MAG: DNA-binding response regulator [Oscillatoriales cyanobacterium]TAF04484.1 MAG: DNA-binding response regulator [Oscillatoriales cyanobacterium]TAF64044.1 MAG: DNA-binding response regulator [Oscillatoriales cyanobacterium]
MTPEKILVVDDDPAIRNLIHRFLSQQGYQVESGEDGHTGMELFKQFNPKLVILDVNLPDTTGYSLCKQMQKETGVFVVMLTSRTDEHDKVIAFDCGADDYITKPFSLVEIKIRVAALLRRLRQQKNSEEPESRVFGKLAIDPLSRVVTLGGQIVALTALEFDLLYCLASKPGRVWRRAELLQEVWDYEYVGADRVVDVHIGQIRRKIEPDSNQNSMIQTVRGVGYKFVETSS